MNRRLHDYVRGTSVVFLLIAVLHLSRLALQWPAVIAGVGVPLWASAVAMLVAGGLGIMGLRVRVSS